MVAKLKENGDRYADPDDLPDLNSAIKEPTNDELSKAESLGFGE